MDIRYLGVGVTIYLPCYLDGCGLAIGDVHFAQGDGEISGTAIEMDSDTMVTTEVITGRASIDAGASLRRTAMISAPPRLNLSKTTVCIPLADDEARMIDLGTYELSVQPFLDES